MKKYLDLNGLKTFLSNLCAKAIGYDNSASGLSATTVQGAVDEVAMYGVKSLQGGNFVGDVDDVTSTTYPANYWVVVSEIAGTHPVVSGWYALECLRLASTLYLQRATVYNGGVYKRLYVNGAWQNWSEF